MTRARRLASLMLTVVGAPSAAIVAASVAASKATVVTVAASLVTTASLMTETAKATILAALSTLKLVQVSWVTAEALLMRLLRKALALARGVVGSRSGTARLATQRRWARSIALRIAEGL